MSDGSEWVNLVTGTIAEERTITPLMQSRIRNVLMAELLTSGMPVELKDSGKLSITFPERPSPAVRIHLNNSAPDAEKNAMSDFIASKTEHSTGAATFQNLKKSGAVRCTHAGGYHGRCDTTIAATNVDSLVDAIGSMVSNPIIKKQFLESDRGAERG